MDREAELLERYDRVISDTMKNPLVPFVLDTQEGTQLTGINGDELLDFSATWAVANTGHRHPAIRKRIEAQLGRASTNCPVTMPHAPVIELAERLIEVTVPWCESPKVWFGHSGSEAGDLVARALPATDRGDHVLSFAGSFHGGTSGAGSISGMSRTGTRSDVSFLEFPYGHPERPPIEDQTTRALERAKDVFEGYDVCGVITEALQSDGGIRVPTEGFLPGVADLCEDHNAYLVIDEVKAGLGRTGEYFAFQHEKLRPDAVMLGKPLGSGLPISAVVGAGDLVDFEPATHMMTTAAAPLPAVAALETLDIIDRENLVERAADLGDHLRATLETTLCDLEEVTDVRGRGLMQGVELGATPELSGRQLTTMTLLRARELGLHVVPVGVGRNVLELTPPLTIAQDEVERGVKQLRRAIVEAREGAVDATWRARYRDT